MSNNVNRFHPDYNTNYLAQAIPLVVGQAAIRNRVVLSIIDGIHGLWDGGPQGSTPLFSWENKTVYFATDVVAADRIACNAINQQRLLAGLQPVESAPANAYDNWTVRQTGIAEAGMAGLGEWRDSSIQYQLLTV